MDRFRGLMRAHGRYVSLGKKNAKGKIEGQAKTLKEPVSESKWESHLLGKIGLGTVPVDDEGKSWFGAADIDVYDLDLISLEKEVRDLGLPLIVCRTKSGGAHLYLFFKEPVEAKFLRSILSEWSARLGYPEAEIFPKQDKIEKESDVGNWINMPYFGETRRAVYEGRDLTPEEFLDLADRIATTKGEIKKLKVKEVKEDDFSDGPPCLQVLAKKGFPEGTRNNGLLNIGIYCKMKDEDTLEESLEELNRRYMKPPLPAKDVMAVLKSVRKKDYFYKCKDQPILSVCKREICLKREFGISKNKSDLGVAISDLQKIMTTSPTDSPTWVLKVNEFSLKLADTEDFLQQNRFRKASVNQLNIYPNRIKDKEWDKRIRELLKTVKEILAPDDSGEKGSFMDMFNKYIALRLGPSGKPEDREALNLGKPYESNGWISFRSMEMIEWMKKKKFSITPKEAWDYLRDMGAVDGKMVKSKGDKFRVWKIPSDSVPRQTEPSSIPEVPGKEGEF
jgi:hypothetical protein